MGHEDSKSVDKLSHWWVHSCMGSMEVVPAEQSRSVVMCHRWVCLVPHCSLHLWLSVPFALVPGCQKVSSFLPPHHLLWYFWLVVSRSWTKTLENVTQNDPLLLQVVYIRYLVTSWPTLVGPNHMMWIVILLSLSLNAL